jgi:hypothetical protein
MRTGGELIIERTEWIEDVRPGGTTTRGASDSDDVVDVEGVVSSSNCRSVVFQIRHIAYICLRLNIRRPSAR